MATFDYAAHLDREFVAEKIKTLTPEEIEELIVRMGNSDSPSVSFNAFFLERQHNNGEDDAGKELVRAFEVDRIQLVISSDPDNCFLADIGETNFMDDVKKITKTPISFPYAKYLIDSLQDLSSLYSYGSVLADMQSRIANSAESLAYLKEVWRKKGKPKNWNEDMPTPGKFL